MKSEREIIMETYKSESSFFVFDKDLNYANTLFGGKLMSECDCEAAKVGWMIVKHINADNAVTRAFNMNFVEPAVKGDLISMRAYVESIGNTSIKIKVDCYKILSPSNSVYMGTASTVFVALKDGKPFKININDE
jgi:acyl-CoA hydrolase